MYNWRILLGGVATASILTVGVAAPAFAQSAGPADLPTSGLGAGGSAARACCAAWPAHPGPKSLMWQDPSSGR